MSFSNAGVYKCVNKNGATSFQATPCAQSSKKKIIKLPKKKKNNKLIRCQSICDGNSRVCTSKLEKGLWNTDGGLELCEKEKKGCHVACVDPDKSELLKMIAEVDRSNYETKDSYNKAFADMDEKYNKNVEADELRWECRESKSSLKDLEANWSKKKKGKYTTSELGYYRSESAKLEGFLNRKCN